MSKMQFIKVMVDFDFHGKVTPVKVVWPDGREFQIDRVLDVRPRQQNRAVLVCYIFAGSRAGKCRSILMT